MRSFTLLFMLGFIAFTAQAQSGIFESYIILDAGSGNTYYDLQATTGNPDFTGSLGSFVQCAGTLTLNGAQNKTFKCPGDDITNGAIWYRVYPTGSPSGAFVSVNLPFAANLGSGCNGNDQQWETSAANVNLLSNRTPGNYTLEVYTTSDFTYTGGGGGSGTHFSNNGGANYSATFTVTGGATCPVFVTASGATAFASYTTLKGAFDAVNAGTHTGAITIDIAANTTETAAGVLNSSGAGSASYTSVLIRPTADGVTVSGPTVTGRGLIEFNGADNVTLDGDNPNSAGINRNLTITNTAANTVNYTMVVRVAVATSTITSADNIVIKNCNVNGSGTGRNISSANSSTGTENTTYGIYAGGGASTSSQTTAPSAISSTTTTVGSGGTMSGLTISNNAVNACARGIAVQGSATSVVNTLTVTNNVVGPAASGSTTSVYAAGITLQGFAAAQVSGNTIQNMESYLAQTIWALDFGSVSATGTNAVVEKNTIQKVNLQNSGTYGVYGINLNAGNGFTIRNNMVSDLQSNMTGGLAFSTGFGIYGIRINAGTGHSVYHNSVHLFGLRAGTANSSLLTAALGLINTAQTGCDIRNNILSNTISGGTTSVANVSIYLPSGASSSLNLILNNNAYYSGTDAARQGVAQVGTTAGTGFYLASNFNASSTSPAANLRAYTSTLNAGGANDNASFATTTTVPYTSATDLHIPAATSTLLESGGATVGVTTDIDGDARPNGLAPDIGADEFSGTNPNICSGTPTAGTISSVPASICTNSSAVLTLTGATSGVGISYQWKEATAPGGPYTNVGTNSATYTTGIINATRYYVVDVTCSAGPSTVSTSEFTLVVNPLPTVTVSPSSGLICNPGGTAVSLTASGASTYTWAPATGLNMTTGATVSANPAATTTYTVIGTDGNGCQNTATVTVTVGVKPAISSATATPATVCTGDNSQLNVVAGEAINTVSGGGITINSSGNATPYPSTISVSSVPGTITNLKVTITNLTHSFPVDIDMVLFGPTGAHSIIFTDAIGGSGGITNRTYTFQAGAPALATSGFPASGTYGVAGSSYNGIGTPSAVSNTGLGVFNGTNPNGTWSLYVYDDATGDAGSIGSWSMEITTGAPVATYSWSPATFLNNAAIANPLASNVTATTTYTVTATAASGCFSTADVTVTVNPTPTATVSGGGTVCSTDPLPNVSFALTGTGPWDLTYNDGTNNVPVTGINTSPYVITNAPAGTYTVVSLSDANCTGTGSGSAAVAVTTATAWYQDSDGDTYGDPSVSQMACSQPSGYVANNTDCDDNNMAVNPGATEVCADGIDNNCDTQIDENCSSCPATGTVWYVDAAAASGGNGASWTCAFQQIQTAINAAVNGDQILVAAGTYVENLFVNKSLTISGVDGRDLTFVHAATATYTLHVDGNAGAPVLSGNVTIEGFTFADPQRLHWCIVATDHIATGLQLTFRNNRITDGNRYGFWDYHSHGILLCENNSFSDVYYGMLLEGWDTGMVTIQNNEFTNLHFYLDQNGVANPAFGGPVGILSMTYSAGGGVDCTNPYRIFENHFHTYANDGFGIVFNGGLTGNGTAKYTDVEISRNTIAPGATGTGIRLRNLPAPNNSPNGGVHNAGIYNNFISNVLFGIRLQGDNPGTEATQNSLVNCSTDAIENTGTALMEASCNWYGSAAAASVAPQITGNVNYQSWLVNGTDDDLVTLGFQPVSGSCTGCAQPVLQTTINTVVVTNNNNGTDDTGSFSVCNGEDVVFDNFQDISGLSLTGLKVYQTATYTNLSPTFCNNCAALLSTYTGTTETATLTNPALPGTLVLRFRAWADADGNNMVDPGECSGDWIQYTVTVLPTQLWYVDADGDGYGTGVGQSLCANPGPGFATQAGDC
ncbi:MAG TPA: MopE-related protein, partial [Saprospiraceae bacterium]|nr:MopE-related protein [Saprospiraceae bacterium]